MKASKIRNIKFWYTTKKTKRIQNGVVTYTINRIHKLELIQKHILDIAFILVIIISIIYAII